MLKLLYQSDRDTFKSHYLVVNKRTTQILSCETCIEIKDANISRHNRSRLIYNNRSDATSFRTRFFVESVILCGDRERIWFEFNNLSALKSVSMSVFTFPSSAPLMRIVNVSQLLFIAHCNAHPRNNKGIKQHRYNDLYERHTKK